MEVEDIKGKKVKAIKVFSGALKCLMNHLLNFLNQKKNFVKTSSADIHWVLTVPAIWNDGSKQFMQDAAEMAGIPSDLLTLALEPEAAAIYCILEANEFFMRLTQSHLPLIKESIKYILYDLGDGTGEITCHGLTRNGVLRELHAPTGGDSCLIGLLGMKVLNHFQERHTEDYLDLLESFERKKYSSDDTRPEVMLYISSTFLQNSPKGHLVEIRSDTLVIKAQLMKSFFKKSISQIKHHIHSLLDIVSSAGISQLFVIGAFSESKYVQKVLKECFGRRIEFIIPPNPAAVVIKGAVYFGHNPDIISYEFHPSSELKIRGVAYVDDISSIHVRRGDIVELEKETAVLSCYPAMSHITQVILPQWRSNSFCRPGRSRPMARAARGGPPLPPPSCYATVLPVYASVHPNPTYVVEEGCRHVGNVIAELSDFADADQMELLVKLMFGGTEIKYELHKKNSGCVVEESVDFLV
ncbi:hypothetical protein ACJMK2_030826 [Sinanodonta woodiana]|uniref:Heat shock 70 kDa protein 12A n=1 Tax=Sinanodonta woodiana TaxID=1069815 RepID=A0ABD3WWZ5_SINWO